MRIRHYLIVHLVLASAFLGSAAAEEPKEAGPSGFSLDNFFEDGPEPEKPTRPVNTETPEVDPGTTAKADPDLPESGVASRPLAYTPEEISKGREVYRLAKAMERAGRTEDAEKYYRLLERWSDAEIIRDASNPEKSRTGDELLAEAKKRLGWKNPKWPEGRVVFSRIREPELEKDYKKRSEEFIRDLQQDFEIKYVGQSNPFFDKCTFMLNSNRVLKCYDEYGREKWKLTMPTDLNRNQMYYHYYNGNFNQLTTYLKASNHILFLVNEKTLYAIDTLRKDGPEIIWKKEKTDQFAPYIHTQSIVNTYMFNRQAYGYLSASTNMISNAVHLGPNILCYQDLDTVYGIDPLSGETQWTCFANDPQVSFAGDSKYVYLIPKNEARGLVLDASNGEVLAAAILPQGIVHSYGSHIFVANFNSGNNNNIAVYDLAGIMDLPEDLRDPRGNFPNNRSHLKYVFRKINLSNYQSYIKLSHNGGILELFHANNLNLIDLNTGENVLNVRIASNQMTQQLSDFETERVGEDFLVTIYSHRNVVPNNNREIGQLSIGSIQQRQIGSGFMMLYDKEGNSLWDKPANITNCFRLPLQPAAFPVVLFGGLVNDNRGATSADLARQYAMVYGVDKRTGEIRFAKQLGRRYGNNNKLGPNNTKMPPLTHGFMLSADPEKGRIIFTAPYVSFAATFTNRSEKTVGALARESTAEKVVRAVVSGFRDEMSPDDKSSEFQKRLFERSLESLSDAYPAIVILGRAFEEAREIEFD